MADFVDREGVEWTFHGGGSVDLRDDDMILAFERCGDDSGGVAARFADFANLFDHTGVCSSWDIVIYREDIYPPSPRASAMETMK